MLIDGGYATQSMKKEYGDNHEIVSQIDRNYKDFTDEPSADKKKSFKDELKKLFVADKALGSNAECDVVKYLNNQNVDTLDYVISTHHIGIIALGWLL